MGASKLVVVSIWNLLRSFFAYETGNEPQQLGETEAEGARILLKRLQPAVQPITPDFSEAPFVDPALTLSFGINQRVVPFLFNDRLFVAVDRLISVYDSSGRLERELATPIAGFSPALAIDEDRLVFKKETECYVWTISSNDWSPARQLSNISACAWVGDVLLAFTLEDRSSHHSEDYYSHEVAATIAQAGWVLRPIADQTLGGKLQSVTRSGSGHHHSSARFSPSSKLAYRARSAVGQTCSPSDPQEPPTELVRFRPDGIGVTWHHWRAYPRTGQSPAESVTGRCRDGLCYAVFAGEEGNVLQFWSDPRLTPALCAECGEKVELTGSQCRCGAAPPEGGVRPGSMFPGQLVFSPDFDARWDAAVEPHVSLEGDTLRVLVAEGSHEPALAEATLEARAAVKSARLCGQRRRLYVVYAAVLGQPSRIVDYPLDPALADIRPAAYQLVEEYPRENGPFTLPCAMDSVELEGCNLLIDDGYRVHVLEPGPDGLQLAPGD